MVCALSGSYRPVGAETRGVVIEMPVQNQMPYGDLIKQAESLVSRAIDRQFSQNAGLSTIQVMVVSDRNGEAIPILMTTVARAQWQTNSQVSQWTRYYSSSYALLERHQQAETVAMVPVGSSATPVRAPSLIEIAYDQGQLRGEVAQDYLSDLD